MSKLLRSAALSALVCAATAGAALAGDLPNYLYPDIVPYVREGQQWLVNWDISGDNLRMQTIYANVGHGLFEIRSGAVVEPGRIQVLQRVYIDTDAGGAFQDFPINTAVSGHVEHGHLHFEDFSMFELFEAVAVDGGLGVGQRVAGGVKTSFRLRDGLHLPEPEWADKPSFPSSNLGTHQRVSVGWGDIYSHGTEGQSFSIAGVPVGPLYWLRQTADPENVVLETDETNNVAQILIDLSRPGEAIFFGDRFWQVGDPVPGDLTADGLVNIADWQQFVADAGTQLDGLSPVAAYRTGDIDLDGVHGLNDFVLFRKAYVAAGNNPADLVGVPEPQTAILCLIATAAATWRRRRTPRKGLRQRDG